MNKSVLTTLLVLLSFTSSYTQVNYVRLTPTLTTALTTVADLDTMVLRFGKNLTSPVAFDTSKAGRTVFLPAQDFIAAQGKFTLELDRATTAADSFKIYFKKLLADGYTCRRDSTFLLGSASTYGTFARHSQFEIIINGPCMGFGIFFLKGDGGSVVRTVISARIAYTQ